MIRFLEWLFRGRRYPARWTGDISQCEWCLGYFVSHVCPYCERERQGR